jgi:phenylpyruvate tautomerase PptA (4-oxalocrotonate tautomerase family)
MDNLDNKAKTSGTGAGLNRRDVMVTAAVAAVAAGSSTVVAEPAPAANFGAPLVELHVPAGVLTVEQRGAMIKGVTEVVVEALGQPVGPTKRLFVEIIETAEGGYGVNGQAFVPRPR